MVTSFVKRLIPFLTLLLCVMSANVFAQRNDTIASDLMSQFDSPWPSTSPIIDSATYLFFSLALVGLVWNLATILLRRGDLGDLFFEIIRFLIFTGLFYWLLRGVSQSGSDTFLYNIFDTFTKLGGAGNAANSLDKHANDVINIATNILNNVFNQAQNQKPNDMLMMTGVTLVIAAALVLVSAQMVLMVIMAWMLAYGGIFLLGFGGARWTSPIAISYYKHAVAVGVALLALIFLMNVGVNFLDVNSGQLQQSSVTIDFVKLADVFVIALIMVVIAIKLPSLLYTLVTGSPLGLLSGTASMAGMAFATGGRSAITSVTNALAQHNALAQYTTSNLTQHASIAQHAGARSESHHHSHQYHSQHYNQHHHATAAVAAVGRASQEDTAYQTMNTGGHFAAAGGAASSYSQPRAEGNVFGGPPPVSTWSSGAAGQSTTQFGHTGPGSTSDDRRSSAGVGNGADSVRRAASLAAHGGEDPTQRVMSGTGTGHLGDRDVLQRAASTAAHNGDDSVQRMMSGTGGGHVSDRDALQRAASTSTREGGDSIQRAASSAALGHAGSQSASMPGVTPAIGVGSTSGTQSPGQAGSKSSFSSVHTTSSTGGFQPAALQRSASSMTGAAKGDSTPRLGGSMGGFQPGALAPAKTPPQSGVSMSQSPGPSAKKVEKTVRREDKKKIMDPRKDKRKITKNPDLKSGNQRPGRKPSAADVKDQGKDAPHDRSPPTTDGDGGDET